MNSDEFTAMRKNLGKTQKQMAELLGTSLKAVHSYEQGWRNVPAHAERQLLFLFSRKQEHETKRRPCWTIRDCPPELKLRCPAWEFQAGKLCWFINGTICEGIVHKDWREKMKQCRDCDVFSHLFCADNTG
jgi:hypothetical protein